MPTFRIRDRHTETEFDGELLASVTTRNRGSERWVEIEMYRTDGGYIVHRVGQSLVYHRADTRCTRATTRQSGEPATIDDLPDDAVPCRRCLPPYPEDLDGPIRYEFPRHTIDNCDSAEMAIQRLTTVQRRGAGARTVVVSEPVKELLDLLARTDPEFASAERPSVRIS